MHYWHSPSQVCFRDDLIWWHEEPPELLEIIPDDAWVTDLGYIRFLVKPHPLLSTNRPGQSSSRGKTMGQWSNRRPVYRVVVKTVELGGVDPGLLESCHVHCLVYCTTSRIRPAVQLGQCPTFSSDVEVDAS